MEWKKILNPTPKISRAYGLGNVKVMGTTKFFLGSNIIYLVLSSRERKRHGGYNFV